MPWAARADLGHEGLMANPEPVKAADGLVEHGLIVVLSGRLFGRPDQELRGPLGIRPPVAHGKLELGQRRDGVERAGVRPLGSAAADRAG